MSARDNERREIRRLAEKTKREKANWGERKRRKLAASARHGGMGIGWSGVLGEGGGGNEHGAIITGRYKGAALIDPSAAAWSA